MKIRILGVALGAALAAASIVPAVAAPGDSGGGFGGCVDNLYGNATNPRPSGNGVLPSQSPGPFVNTGFNEPPRNDRTMGLSMGNVMQILTGSGFTGADLVQASCPFQ